MKSCLFEEAEIEQVICKHTCQAASAAALLKEHFMLLRGSSTLTETSGDSCPHVELSATSRFIPCQ